MFNRSSLYQNSLWKYFTLPQTVLLLLGVSLGYLVFVGYLYPRPIVLIVGGAIALITLAVWFWQFRQPHQISRVYLLQQDVFQHHLTTLDRQIPMTAKPDWDQAQQWAQAAQVAAMQIAQQEPNLIPELLEALHTVLDLADQVVEGLVVMESIHTSAYRSRLQQQREDSQTRLRQTHDQLQQLQDQMALNLLERRCSINSTLPARLQLLIAENKLALKSDISNI
jgi:hypothetical protein